MCRSKFTRFIDWKPASTLKGLHCECHRQKLVNYLKLTVQQFIYLLLCMKYSWRTVRYPYCFISNHLVFFHLQMAIQLFFQNSATVAESALVSKMPNVICTSTWRPAKISTQKSNYKFQISYYFTRLNAPKTAQLAVNYGHCCYCVHCKNRKVFLWAP